ncbi:MAG: hypothetical protein IJ666_03355 [Ruminococcus sp.]|nr:hypothetical protein [Ruminococcus sp.]
MASKKVAQLLLCRCSRNKELFGITMEQRTSNEWEFMYSYPIEEKRTESEGFDSNTVTASMYFSSSFAGCPYCRTLSFFQCGICHRINCNPKDGDSAECAWCSARLTEFDNQDETTVPTGAD